MFSLSLRGVQPEPRPDAATQISRASHSGSRYVFLPTLYLYVCVSHAFASVPCPQASSLWPPLECRVECISVFNAALYTFNLKWHWTASFDHGQDFALGVLVFRCHWHSYEIASFPVLLSQHVSLIPACCSTCIAPRASYASNMLRWHDSDAEDGIKVSSNVSLRFMATLVLLCMYTYCECVTILCI